MQKVTYKLSIEKSEKLFGENHPLTAGSYLAYGDFCIAIKNYTLAEELISKAFKITYKKFGNKNREISIICSRFGDLFNDKHQYEKALDYYQNAIIATSKDFNNENIYANPAFENINPEFNNFVLLYKKAYALYDKFNKSDDIKDLQCSYETSKLAIALFETIIGFL